MNTSMRASGAARAASLVLLVAASFATQSTLADSTKERIAAHCEAKWPTDYEMQEYCAEQQRDGVRAVFDFLKRYGIGDILDDEEQLQRLYNERKVPVVIAIDCLQKWDDDYEMIAYCLDQQEQSAKRLGKL